MNSKVEVSQTKREYVCIENKRDTQLAQSQYVPGGLSWPLYIGGQVSRIRSGSNYSVRIRYQLIFRLCL
jgi:hypothetical protein